MNALFRLVFKQSNDVKAIIQPAGDIISARIRAMLTGIEGQFQEGHELDDKTARKVPKPQIGKILARGGNHALE